jgi:acetyl-CoA C-acetyltransferase
MGEHCEAMAQRWQIKRLAQDELALNSHRRLDAAYRRGFFDDLVSPYRGLTRDNNLRADASLEKLAGLGPAYDRQHGTLTAGNSTPLTDGASVVLLASEEWAAAHQLPVLAYLRTGETAAVNFVDGSEGLLMAPAYAVPRMLAREGLGLKDFDFYEIHEAFAAQVLCTLKAWEDPDYCRERLGLEGALGSLDRDKLNVNGGSLGCGHPFAATGGRLLASLAKAIHERGGGRGLISVCAAGGLGITAIVEK